MTSPRHIQIRTAIVLTIAGLSLAPFPAHAAGKKAKGPSSPEVVGLCVSNYKSGLEREQTGHLLQARELFIKCAKAACGSPLREECTTRFTQLSTDIPSVVPMVTDEAGGPQTDVEVKVDGERLTSSLDGHSFVLDPGVREFSFSKDGRIFATQKVMIVQGQRNRLIAASLQGGQVADNHRPAKQAKKINQSAVPAAMVVANNDNGSSEQKAAPPPALELAPRKVTPHESNATAPAPELNVTAEEPTSTGPSALTYVLAGTGVAAVAAGATLILWGRKDNSRLPECATMETNCPQSAVDHIHNLYLGGNIALGVGVASLGAAYWLYTHPSKEASKEEAYRLDVQPTKSGAVASVSGSF